MDLCEICSKVENDCSFCGGIGSVKIGRKRGACSHCSGNGHVCDGSKASKVVGGSSSSSSSSSQCCDRCGEEEHRTGDRPHFIGGREQHPAATTRRSGYKSDVSAHPTTGHTDLTLFN